MTTFFRTHPARPPRMRRIVVVTSLVARGAAGLAIVILRLYKLYHTSVWNKKDIRSPRFSHLGVKKPTRRPRDRSMFWPAGAPEREIGWAWRNLRARGWRSVLTIGLLALALAANTIVFSVRLAPTVSGSVSSSSAPRCRSCQSGLHSG